MFAYAPPGRNALALASPQFASFADDYSKS